MPVTSPKYYLFILGCQMNYSDAERLATVLESNGYQETKNETAADLIAVVACSVRQSAIDRIHGKVKIWEKLKRQRKLTTILTGCVLPADKKLLAEKFDLVFDITELPQLPQLLAQQNPPLEIPNYFSIPPRPQSKFKIAIPIMTGCNNFCAYCAVPYTRGREKSRPSQEIITAVETYIHQGYKEITLLGQNVNSYGHDRPGEISFSQLLKKINSLPGEWWLRFLTSHPKDMSEDLIAVMAERRHLCEHLHLPVQAGNNKVLKRMNRQYTVRQYKKLITKIRRAVPEIAISTDTIVGFPGENKRQFNQTKRLYKKIGYDLAYIAKYSPRPGTLAAGWKDNIPLSEKKRREKILTAQLEKSAGRRNHQLIGKTLTVLVDESVAGYLNGKTRSLKSVQIPSDYDLTGQFIKVKILAATPYNLQGKKEDH